MYPCWRYKEGETKIIFSLEEEQRLGGIWYNTPTELELAQLEVGKKACLEPVSEVDTQPKVKKRIKKDGDST